MIASDVPSISWYGDGQLTCMVCTSSSRAKREEEAEAEDARFADDVEGRNEPVERRAFAHADHVERRESRRSAQSTTEKWTHGWADPVSTGMSWLR